MMKHFIIILFTFTFVKTENYDLSDKLPTELSDIDLTNLIPAELNLGIINGKEVQPNAFPFQASITIKYSRSKIIKCGGTLINERFILTAAHCVKGAVDATILLGAHNIRIPEKSQILVKARRFKYHENYSSFTHENDIGLIELDCAVRLTPNITTVKLPPKIWAWKSLVNKNATTIGWGFTDTTKQFISPVLQVVEDKIQLNFLCWLKFPLNVKNTNICISGQEGKSACNGDSGGPLLVDGYQVGITSFGARGCSPGYPTVFTRITSYLNWIEKNII